MNRNRKLAKNISFIVIGNIGSKLLGFFMLPFYTSWLSPVEYGVTDLLLVYANLLLNVVACDISDAIYIFPIGANDHKVRKYYSTGFLFQIICSILCVPIFHIISYWIAEKVLVEHIWFIYGILISNLFQKYTQDFCRGINKMSVFSYTGIIQTITTAILSFLLIPIYGVSGFVIATIGGNSMTALFTFIYSKSYRYLYLGDFELQTLKEMLNYSIPLIPTAIFWWLISGLNRPLLEEYVGLYAIGLMAVAGKFPGMMNLIFNFFQQAWIVTVVEEYKKDDFEIYFNKMFQMIVFIQILTCLVLFILAKPFISFMAAYEFHEAWKYIPLLTIAVLFSNTSAFLGSIFSATRKSKYTFYSVIIGGISAVATNLILIPVYGLWGACLSICLSHVITTISRIWYSRKLVKFNGYSYFLKQSLLLLFAYLTIFMPHRWILYICYTACFLFFFYINKENVSYIKAFVISKIKKR